MSFGLIAFTNRGKALQAKAQAGAQLNFTRIAVGDGELSGQSISDLTNLIHQVKSLNINKFKTLPGGKAIIGGVLSNQDIITGFWWRELGLFATDPDLGEILYCYGNAGALAEYIPTPGGAEILEKQVDVVSIIGNAANVSATIEQSLVYATAQELQVVQDDLNAHKADYAQHITDLTVYKSREHKVTPYLFGAIGDNSPHPLSERYATLEEAQVDYPFATSLDQLIDTCAIQKAFDTVEGTLDFSKGKYVVSGSGDACLYLRRKLNLVGLSPNRSSIRADNLPPETSVLKIAFDYNWGAAEVRNWRMENLAININVGGKHAVWIANGYFPIMSSKIENCVFGGNPENDGYSIWAGTIFSHSQITRCTLSTSIYLNCGDNNLIEKNLFYGTRVAITFDCAEGVYNNTVRDNTIVNRDGAVHIKNGDAMRIINNQIELAQGYGVSQSPVRAMVWVEGVDRPCQNCVIEQNNFGGGTSLDYLIYIDNAIKPVITKNQFISTNTAEVLFTANCKYAYLLQDNTVKDTDSNVRPRARFKAEVSDNGIGSCGVLKNVTGHQNGWTGGSFFKDESGTVHFYNPVSGGTTAVNTSMFVLPEGFRPFDFTNIPIVTSGGVGYVKYTTNGQINCGSVPSNSEVILMSFQATQTEVPL